MATKITIDPLVRVEGHLKVECVIDGGEVKEADCSGPMFRGFERLLIGRDPLDAQQIAMRVCGVCPMVHGTAAALALDEALGVNASVPDNGRIVRNLMLASNFLQSHILHFYHLAALDYVDCTKVAGYDGADPGLQSVKAFIDRGELGPFMPRYEGDYRLPDEVDRAAVAHYVQALQMRRKAHEMLAIFGGKMPHTAALVPGGVTESVTTSKIADFLWRLNELRGFIDNVLLPDALAIGGAYNDYFAIGKGCGAFLSYGGFELESGEADLTRRKRFFARGTATAAPGLPGTLDVSRIREDVKHAHYADATTGLHPTQGETEPDMTKGHTWLKAPRYDGKAYEVGPLARAVVGYLSGHAPTQQLAGSVLSGLHIQPEDMISTMGRHVARALEAKMVADTMASWLLQLQPGAPAAVAFEMPDEASGTGILEGPRGALLHHIAIQGGKISRYQLVVPTTWNCSPKDDQGQPGPVEQALIGTKVSDPENPLEIVRIVRSFDPCLACAVHVVNVRRDTVARIRVA